MPKRVGFAYVVKADIVFTQDEIEKLVAWALMHYDAGCRAAAEPCPQGFLNALRWRLDDSERWKIEPRKDSVCASLTHHEIDTLAKICEDHGLDGTKLNMQLTEIMNEISAEWARLTGH